MARKPVAITHPWPRAAQHQGERPPMDTDQKTIVREATRLRTQGVGIVWICPGEKRPRKPGWTLASEEPADYTPGSNLGIQCGGLSEVHGGYLVCVDLDKPQALELADA